MANIKQHLTELIGHTPLLKLNRWRTAKAAEAEIIVKIERNNPGGSVKDRPALAMIEAAEREGILQPSGTIIEPTSGNTGVGLAWIAAVKGYRTIFTMPETMSRERQLLLKAYGAEIVLTPGAEGMSGAIRKAEQLRGEIAGAVILQQFENEANPLAHEQTTAEEIWKDTDGCLDIFVATVGTGGTLTGTSRGLKKHNPEVKTIAVEPAKSPVLSGGKAGAHKIQGIGAGFIPKIYDGSVVDEVLTVSDEAAYETARQLAREEGLLIGISGGAAAFAAGEIARRPENKGKRIVVILPDTGERYLSTDLFG